MGVHAGLLTEARKLTQERRLADAAGTVDVDQLKGRVGCLKRRLPQGQFGRASDESALSRCGESISQTSSHGGQTRNWG